MPANDYKKAKCYWVQILAKGSFCELWSGHINGKEYSHSWIDNKEYYSSNIRVMQEPWANRFKISIRILKRIVDKYEQHGELRVYYNPKKPQEAVLENGVYFWIIFLLIIGIVLMSLAITSLILLRNLPVHSSTL